MKRGDAEAQRLAAVTETIIGAAIEVHRALGPGLLESAYEECLCHELALQGMPFRRQVTIPVVYKAIRLDCAYVLDLLVDEEIVVELKAVDALLPIHSAQLLTYLRLLDKRLGLLVNFKAPRLVDGIKRVVNGL